MMKRAMLVAIMGLTAGCIGRESKPAASAPTPEASQVDRSCPVFVQLGPGGPVLDVGEQRMPRHAACDPSLYIAPGNPMPSAPQPPAPAHFRGAHG
jgi:hypothetical protein